MTEVKIRFKSGEIGYFELKEDNINKIFNRLGDAIRDNETGVIELIDLVDEKRTIIDVTEIATFGYSEVK